MGDLQQIFGDEPDGLVGAHPITIVKPGQIHRTRIPAEGAFKPKIEINVEVAHREFPESAINRLTVTTPGEIRFGHCSPMATNLVDRNDMISVAVRFQIEDQRRKSDRPQRGSGKNAAIEA